MKNLCWRLIKHSELLIPEEIRIANLKEQRWSYGIDSQIHWIKENIYDDDYHLLGEEKTEDGIVLIAYLNLVNVQIELDKNKIEAIGIGNVCVDKNFEHSGYGRSLVLKADEYITGLKKQGILLCKDSLIEFYRKCGWKIALAEKTFAAGVPYFHTVMLFPLNEDITYSRIIVSRNF